MKIPKPAVWVATLAVAAVALFQVGAGEPTTSAFASGHSDISVSGEPSDRDPELYQGSFLDASLPAMLVRLGVQVAPEDKAYAFPDPALGVGSLIRVYRAQQVEITDAGKKTFLRTWAKTVGELAEERQLELAEKDVVTPGIGTEIPVQAEPFRVSVVRVAESSLSVTTEIKFATAYKDDPNLQKGITRIETAGKVGKLKTTYLVRRENGKEVSRKKTGEERTLEPVSEVIIRGTKVVNVGTGKASWYDLGQPAMTAAHNTLPKGTKVRVTALDTGKSVVVTIADRGIGTDAIIDLTPDAFKQLAPLSKGIVRVKLELE